MTAIDPYFFFHASVRNIGFIFFTPIPNYKHPSKNVFSPNISLYTN